MSNSYYKNALRVPEFSEDCTYTNFFGPSYENLNITNLQFHYACSLTCKFTVM